jgi:hypothetical protein
MLEGLPAVNWKRLTHAYGPAGDVPDRIRALTSPDPEQWVDALDGLYATLCHQSCTVYEATPPAIPFLVELLGYRKVRCRGRILQFLGDAARATSYLAAHGDILQLLGDTARATSNLTAHGDEEQETEEFKRQLAEEMEWVRQTREAIWNGLDVYLDLLADLDKRLRIMVPYTLGLLADHAAEAMPESVRKRDPYRLMSKRMAQQLDEEPSELVRASLIFGLGRLVPHRPEVKRLLERHVKDRKATKRIRLSAALCLSSSKAKLPAIVLNVLLDALKNPEETNHLFDSDQLGMEEKHHPLYKAYRKIGTPLSETAGLGFDADDVGKDEDFRFPWLDGWPTFTILERLSRPDADYLDRAVSALTPYLDQANGYTVESVAGPILRLVFGDRKITPKTRRKDLTPPQAEVLQHLYDNLHLWATDIGNVDSVFEKFGLSHDRKDWQRLLGIKEKPLTDSQIEKILRTLLPAQQYAWEGPTIRRINLCEIGTAAFLPHLKQYADVEDLDLGCIPLSDDDLQHLVGFRKLRKLHIPSSLVTDAGAAMLTALKELRDLNLSKTRITDTALSSLKKLPKIRYLYLWDIPISERALKQFKKARPRCKVWR